MRFLSSERALDLLPFVGTVVFLLLGLRGILAARRVRREEGSGALMHYPFLGLLGWARERLHAPSLTPRQVAIFGWIFVALSPGWPLWFFWDDVSPWARARRAHSACVHLVTEAEMEELTGLDLERTYLDDDGSRCRVAYRLGRSTDDVPVDVIELEVRPPEFPGPYAGRSTLEQVAGDMHGRGFILRPVPLLGDDAFLAWMEDQSRDATLVFQADDVPVSIAVDERLVPHEDAERLAPLIESRLSLLERYKP